MLITWLMATIPLRIAPVHPVVAPGHIRMRALRLGITRLHNHPLLISDALVPIHGLGQYVVLPVTPSPPAMLL